MAKKSQRRTVRYEKDQAGCMWGLISIFDFRNGRSTRKLLSDRRHGSKRALGSGYSATKLKMLTNRDEKCQRIEDGEESERATSDVVKTSVKELMEEEMFSELGLKKHMKSDQVELEQFDSKHGVHLRENRERTNKTCTKSCDMHVFDVGAARNLAPENSCHQDSEQKTSNNRDLKVIIEELCQIHGKSTSCVKRDLHDDLGMQSNQPYLVEENLNAAIKVFMNLGFTNGKHLTEDGKVHHSNEFTDVLQKLSSNKELFLKLLQDPNSLLVNHIQEVEDAQLEEGQHTDSLPGSNLLKEEPSNSRPEEHINIKHRSFFRRKSKSRESNHLKGNEKSQPSSRIVILKPGPAALRNPNTEISASTSFQFHDKMENKVTSERNSSQFSFTEIKRKLKHAMGKERHGISRNSITHYEHQRLGDNLKGVGEENAGWSSPNRDHFFIERFAKPSIGIKRGKKIGKSRLAETSLVNETTAHPKQWVSNIYIEAKKHLSDMLSNGDEKELMSRQLPKTLGRILSHPEYNISPSSSPGKDSHSFVNEEMRLSCSNFHMVNQNTWRLIQENHAVRISSSKHELESPSCITHDNPGEKVQSPKSYLDVSDKVNCDNSAEETISRATDDSISEGVVEIVQITKTGYQLDSKVLDVSCDPSSSLISRDALNCDTAELCYEERSSQSLKSDSFEEDPLFSSLSESPSSSSPTGKIEDPENAIDRTERPSPISVLEPLFTEDDISPASIKSQPAIQPLQIHFEERVSLATYKENCISTDMENEESAFEYVEAVLLGSDLNWDEFLLRWLSSNHLLDPSLFDEVELFSTRSCHDQKLLFDCTNEVLKEVCECYFGCSLDKKTIRPIPRGMNLIQEVWEGVEWHLLRQPPSHSLDQLIRKDMAKSGTWMDLRYETEHIVIELRKSILEELMEDSVLSFVNDTMEGEFPVLPA